MCIDALHICLKATRTRVCSCASVTVCSRMYESSRIAEFLCVSLRGGVVCDYVHFGLIVDRNLDYY